MPKGSEALLEYVNAFLEEERRSGRLKELENIYIYGGNDPKTQETPASDLVPALQ